MENRTELPLTLTQLEAAESAGWEYFQDSRKYIFECPGTPDDGEWQAAVQGAIRKAIESLNLPTHCVCKDSDCSHAHGGSCQNCGCATPYSEPTVQAFRPVSASEISKVIETLEHMGDDIDNASRVEVVVRCLSIPNEVWL